MLHYNKVAKVIWIYLYWYWCIVAFLQGEKIQQEISWQDFGIGTYLGAKYGHRLHAGEKSAWIAW